MAETKCWVSARSSHPSAGRKGEIPVHGQKRMKENTKKESRRQDTLGTLSDAVRGPFRIASYTCAEKKPQSADMVLSIVMSRE